MLKNLSKQFFLLCVGMCMLITSNVWAAETPHQLVENVTNDVIKSIEKGKKVFKSNPDLFYQDLDKYLSRFFEFRLFAQNVMGDYGNDAALKAMSADDKKKFNQRLDRFVRIFKQGLITRYGSSLLLFEGQKIEVKPPTAEDTAKIAKGDTVIVTQYIYDDKGKRYSGSYTMKPDASGQWKVRNLTVEGVNVGKVYRQQFAVAMTKNNKDMDKVIDNWSVAIDSKR